MTQYDPHRWLDHLFDIRGSMIHEILGRVSVTVIWAVAITFLYQFAGRSWGSIYIPTFVAQSAVPEVCHALVGGVISLLLVFRTNSSYDRFWEGRKLWGGIVNETRNLVRTSSIFLAAESETVREIVLWTIAFPWCVMARLRGRKDVRPFLKYVDQDSVNDVASSEHVPLAIARRITALLESARQRGRIDSYQLGLIDQNTQLLVDYLGGCERIRATPMPYAYVVHLRRALIFYCGTLPFALVPRFGWATPLAVLLTSYVFFGIEEIGVEIEDPFGEDPGDLPLERICESIERTLQDVLTDNAPG